VTAGSIASPLGDAFADYFRTSVQAILSSGARAPVIGQTQAADSVQDDVLRLPFAPYSVVFPRRPLPLFIMEESARPRGLYVRECCLWWFPGEWTNSLQLLR
jgi:hypothetical protein